MKKTNLVRKILVMPLIISYIPLSLLTFNVHSMNAFGLRKSNTSATKDTETRDYEELANKICEDIADVFYPLRGKAVSGFGNFWTCRTSLNERNVIVSIVEKEENKSRFNLKTLEYELDNFIKVHGKKLEYLFIERDKHLLNIIASSFKGDTYAFRKFLIKTWDNFNCYFHTTIPEYSGFSSRCSNQ